MLEGPVTGKILSPQLREKIDANATITNGSITDKTLSDYLKQEIAAPFSATPLDPVLKAYLAPLLKP